MSYTWGPIEKLEQVNFKDIISQQLENDLKERRSSKHYDFGKNENVSRSQSIYSVESNEMIAKMLQMKLYQDFVQPKNDMVSLAQDENINGFESSDCDSDFEEEDISFRLKEDWKKLDISESHVSPHYRYKSQEVKTTGVEYIHKFGESEAYKLLLDLPDLKLGNGNKGIIISRSNSKVNSNKKRKIKRQRMRSKKISSEYLGVMDNFTFDLINKMLAQKLLLKVDKILNIESTEAVIFHADFNPSYPGATKEFPKELALKIFKKTFLVYQPLPNYYHYLRLFNWRKHAVKDVQRGVINRLARREITNLKKIREAGIRCPQPVMFQRHVVIMSFIGENKTSAPQLKNVKLEPNESVTAYNEVIEAMKIMFQKVDLIHTDILENVLWFNKHCYFIDFSHAVGRTHDDVYDLLIDNCKTVTDFFKKKEMFGILATHELFHFIIGLDNNDDIKNNDCPATVNSILFRHYQQCK